MAPQLTTNTAPDVYRAICQVAKEISKDGISKGKKNEAQGYKFRGIDDIYNALSAVIAGADLCILPRMAERVQEERTTAKGGVLFYVTVRADFDFVSARDGSSHTVTMYGEAMDSADKATNKAMSAAYKYACLQVFCIPTEGMEDADGHTPEPAPRPQDGKWAKPVPVQKKAGDVPAALQSAFALIDKDPALFGNVCTDMMNRMCTKLGSVEGGKAYDPIADEFYARFPDGTRDKDELKQMVHRLWMTLESAKPQAPPK